MGKSKSFARETISVRCDEELVQVVRRVSDASGITIGLVVETLVAIALGMPRRSAAVEEFLRNGGYIPVES